MTAQKQKGFSDLAPIEEELGADLSRIEIGRKSGGKVPKKFDAKKSFLIIGSKTYKKSTINSMIGESKKLFDRVLFVPINKVQIMVSSGRASLCYKGKYLMDFDAIYPRFSSRDYVLGEAVLKVIESSSAYCPVPLRAYQITNHKYYTTQVLSNSGIPGIPTTLFISPKYAEYLVGETGFPMVMKLISGFAGKGVVLINDKKQLESILDTVHLFEEFICTQKFIKGKNFDVRCYVIGDSVISVKRTGRKGEWRANISRGGTAAVIETSPEMKKIALNSARVLGMDICAVDLMESGGRWVVIEANFMPGPFMKYLGGMIVKEWVEFIHEKVKAQKQFG
ncbi:MAG: RimK family alpha-L-glutamate ligase [Candidatus Diapherotrites archaeon]|nr:RimK family alpha-L-glutamate ligase [Candidatus Diapherotrites archaeon]